MRRIYTRAVIATLVVVALTPGVLIASAEQARYHTVIIPTGTPLDLALNSRVTSRHGATDERVHARLWRAIVVGGVPVVPAGAVLSGHVIKAVRSGGVKGRASVGIRFSAVRAADGRHAIRTSEIFLESPSRQKNVARTTAFGAGAGSAVGAGGKKGAVLGTAVGASGGTGAVQAMRGDEVVLGRTGIITTRLTAPLTVRVRIP